MRHLSPRDLRQLFVRAIETPDIERADGVPWLVVYGISGNTRAFWSLESARNVLGYAPEDDAEVKYAADVARLLTGAEREDRWRSRRRLTLAHATRSIRRLP